MRRLPAVLLLLLVFSLALPAGAQAGVPTGRLLVLVRGSGGESARAAAAGAVVARSRARVAGHQVPQIGLVTLAPPAGTSLASLAQRLRADPAVRSVQVEHRAQLRLAPNDPAVTTVETTTGTAPGTPLQWPLGRQGLFRAWDIARGDGALVGVIDTGAAASHPDIAPKLRAAVDQNDDPESGPPTVDEHGHGTHVSSLACAATNNGFGMAGAGWNCGLVIEKSDLTESSIARSIIDATNRGVHAINMSFGDMGGRPPVDAYVAAIDYALARGVVVVGAASDDPVQDQGQPPSLLQPTGTGPDINQGKGLSVTSANFFDGPSGGGLGSQISLAAYGSYRTFGGPSDGPRGLFGAFPSGCTALDGVSCSVVGPNCSCRTTLQGQPFAYIQGTSMAAPQVAAVAAMLRRLNPDVSALEIVRLMKQTARRPAGGWTPQLGWGILDAGAAVDAVRRIDRRPPTSKLRAPSFVRGTRFTLKWTGSDPAPVGLISSGVRRYEVYAKRDGGTVRRIARTTAKRLAFTGRRGSTYQFFTVAVDRAGNREPPPPRADTRTRVRR
jgi:serine protease